MSSEDDVEHRPLYGSSEKDEILCSCGWRGPTYQIPHHFEDVAAQSKARLERFVALVEEEAGEDWEALAQLEARPHYLTPAQFALAMRAFGFGRATGP
ncbi:MAG TPA: hypothetical protein VGF86_03250 [Candidatus Tumulicola sp.]